MKLRRVVFLGIVLILLSSIPGFARLLKESLFDSTFDKSSITVRRVAIIPNRLPMVLEEPEKWRQVNWKITAEMFTKQGFEVVDYDTTLEAVEASNLPLEDTGTSEEKFAATASALNADILIMPYYGTGYAERPGCIGTTHGFSGTVEYQVYSRNANMFIFRSEKVGVASFNDLSACGIIGLLLTMGKTPNKMWTKAFKQANKKAWAPFFAVYPSPTSQD